MYFALIALYHLGRVFIDPKSIINCYISIYPVSVYRLSGSSSFLPVVSDLSKSFHATLSLEVCNPSIWTFPATLHMSQGHNWVRTWSNMRTISILDASFVPRFVMFCVGDMFLWLWWVLLSMRHNSAGQLGLTTTFCPIISFICGHMWTHRWCPNDLSHYHVDFSGKLFYSSLLRMNTLRLDYLHHSFWLFCL